MAHNANGVHSKIAPSDVSSKSSYISYVCAPTEHGVKANAVPFRVLVSRSSNALSVVSLVHWIVVMALNFILSVLDIGSPHPDAGRCSWEL